jgi:hypothetical protein
MIRATTDRFIIAVANAHGRALDVWRWLRSRAVFVAYAAVDLIAYAAFVVCVFVGGLLITYVLRRLS